MASWDNMPDPSAGDSLAYAEAWENRIDSDDRDDATDAERDAGTFEAVEPYRGLIPPYDVEPADEPVPDVEYADEDEAGQLGLGVPGEQRAIPTLADTRRMFEAIDEARANQAWRDQQQQPRTECDLCNGTGQLEDPDDQSHGVTIYEPCHNCDGRGYW